MAVPGEEVIRFNRVSSCRADLLGEEELSSGRRVVRVRLAILTIAMGIILQAEVSVADHTPYHWALEWTSVAQGFYRHDSAGPLLDAYYGWKGISGRIIAPETVPSMNNCMIDHENGALVAYHARGTVRSVLIQIGWFTGTIGDCMVECIRRGPGTCAPYVGATPMGVFIEILRPDLSFREIDLGDVSPGAVATYRVDYNANNDCWRVWLNGVVRANQCQRLFPPNAAMLAGTEIINRSKEENSNAPSIDMPLTRYGSPNADALRVFGANGWELWDSTLTAGFTSRYDESTGQENGIAPRYVISVDNPFYNLITYRQ